MMRTLFSFLVSGVLLAAVACGSDTTNVTPDAGPDGGGDELVKPETGFQIQTPEILIRANEEVTYCYYVEMPNDAQVGVKRWESSMTPGSHHLIMYTTEEAIGEAGTVDQNCGFGTGNAAPVWTYSAQSPKQDFAMPDGIGMALQPKQNAYVEMHYLNASDEDLMAQITINAHTYEDGAEYEQAYPFVTYHTGINVPPHQASEVSGSCAVPEDLKFFTMSTHAHRFSTKAQVHDGGSMLVDTDDWEHPDIALWADDFYQFSNTLDYRCEFFNHTDNVVRTGDSAETDEMCMAVGYFFPATRPYLCLNSVVVPF